MTRLPVILENLRIATPCSADWDEMSGNDKVRFCGQCEKNVYNLSAMTRSEAEALVAKKDGRLCVRLYQRHDGTVITSDCPVGVRRERLRQRIWTSFTKVAASAALFLGVAGGRARADLTLKNGRKPAQIEPVRITGGAVAVVEPPLMGKVSIKPPPKPPTPPKPQKLMGEPRPMMGDVAMPESKDK
jgi:hypothetical protein